MAITLPRLTRPRKSASWSRDEATPSPAPPTTRERQPEGATLLVAGVGVPVLRAIATGIFSFPVALSILVWWGWAWRDVLGGSIFAAAAVCLAMWIGSLPRSWAAFEWALGIDLDGNGQVGKPSHSTVTIEVKEPREHGGGRVTWRDVTLPEGVTIGRIATSVLDGTFTERQWTGRGRPFSQESFRRLRDEAMAAGLLAWADASVPQMGVVVPPDAVAKWRELERKG